MKNHQYFLLAAVGGWLLIASAFAEDPLCQVNKTTPKKRVQLAGQPSWFISADPNGEYVGVIGAPESGNNLISLDKQNNLGLPLTTPVPGPYDPVFTPDGRFITVPMGNNDKPGASFFRAEDLKSKLNGQQSAKEVAPIGVTDAATAAYQSVGVLNESTGKSQYMYIADSRNNDPKASLNYFVADAAHDGSSFEVKKQGELCPGLEGNTPMISNDGKYLSILNLQTKSTQIYKVNPENGSCKMVTDLGVPTGKVSFDFSKNPRKIAFHVDRGETNISWFNTPGQKTVKDTYVMELNVENEGKPEEKWKSKGIQRLNVSNTPGTGTYYPRFRKDGTIVAITVQRDPNGAMDAENNPVMDYYLDVIDPNVRPNSKHDAGIFLADLGNCDVNLSRESYALFSLANLWQQACDKTGFTMRYRDALLIAPNISKEACLGLIDKYYTQQFKQDLKSKYFYDYSYEKGDEGALFGAQSDKTVAQNFGTVSNGFSKDELKKFCTNETTTQDGPTEVVSNQRVAKTPEAAFVDNCGGCHSSSDPTGGFAFINSSTSKVNEKSLDGKQGLNPLIALKSLKSMHDPDVVTRMPPSRPSDGDKKLITTYLLDFIKQRSGENSEIYQRAVKSTEVEE